MVFFFFIYNKAAHSIDTVGAKNARSTIASIKIVAPRVALKVIDRAIQAHGGAGVCQDFDLWALWIQVTKKYFVRHSVRIDHPENDRLDDFFTGKERGRFFLAFLLTVS